MPKPKGAVPPSLSRRERQVMDILHRRGSGSVADVLAELPDPPSYSAVRSVVRILESRSLIFHTAEGTKYVYAPSTTAKRAQTDALRYVVQTFFSGSAEQAVTALLGLADRNLKPETICRLRELIRHARRGEGTSK